LLLNKLEPFKYLVYFVIEKMFLSSTKMSTGQAFNTACRNAAN